MKVLPTSAWLPNYVLSVLAYCWHCWRRRLLAWVATALAISAVLSLAATAELFLVLSQRSLAQQARSASEFQVFLADDAQQPQVQALSDKIGRLHGVKSVGYRSKAQALSLARRDPTLANLASTTPGNPFPASLIVQLADPSAAGQVASVATQDSATDHDVPSSYTPAQGRRLSTFLSTAQAVIIGVAAAALGVASLVGLVLLRSEIRARRAELTVLALVGTPRPVIRLPVLLEAVSLAVAGSLVATLVVVYVGGHLVPGVNSSLPFLQLGRPTDVVAGISLATLAGSVLALGTCSLLVRLPR
ncbi:MAG: permease-like cell division protein FtsX [Candidatus Dormibacteraeota bacterium]|nr:permease-like cell division protein FtsX [Candidatus Dormibacteraeota bacterium]